ncbi:MAG: MOSC domain-containing protein [Ahrensia sp.]|nr:MOSC domain-containing protein [Ahrensia sp.]
MQSLKASVKHLITYPIKGLSSHPLESVMLHAARGFPLDRAFAFARHDSGMDISAPRPMPKSKFLVLARDAALARLTTHFDAASLLLTVNDGAGHLTFDLSTQNGMAGASAFLAQTVGLPDDQRPNFIRGGDIRFTDVCMTSAQYMHCVSIINLASVRAFSAAIGTAVDPHRFRGNLLIDGLAPFAELEMIGHEFAVGGARLRILKRTMRCPATQVNLQTATRDLDVPELLHETYGHRDMGVYAEVIEGGKVHLGDEVLV